MALLHFKNIGISGIAACVPSNKIETLKYTQYFPLKDVEKIAEKTGIFERRFANKDTCSSDLCFHAAEKLFLDMKIDRDEIDVLIFISQTPDYRMPATSLLLQDRLRLSKSCIAFDINLGCSAFIYGLTVASTFLSQPNIRKVLILDGETRSKVYSPKDRKTAFLFGDGGVAAIVERDDKYGESWYSLNSDGSKSDLIKINGGGYRKQSSEETLKENIVDEYGNIRSDEHGYMDGESVFNFVAKEVPRNVKELLNFANINVESLDYYVFHQANDFMNQFLIKKMKLDKEKVPSSISKFGNTSSVSVPLTIVSELKNKLEGEKSLLLSAFGVGMTWASAIIQVHTCKISDIVEL